MGGDAGCGGGSICGGDERDAVFCVLVEQVGRHVVGSRGVGDVLDVRVWLSVVHRDRAGVQGERNVRAFCDCRERGDVCWRVVGASRRGFFGA